MKLKLLKENIFRLQDLIRRYQAERDVLIEVSSEKDFEYSDQYLGQAVATLMEKQKEYPVGHRYTGTFYVREPYSVPVRSIKVNGVAFMREDISSWLIESSDSPHEHGLLRGIFKDDRLREEIQRNDAEPVYEEEI